MPAKLKEPTTTSVRNKIKTLYRKAGELAAEALTVGLGGTDLTGDFHQHMKAAEEALAAALACTAPKGRGAGKAPTKRNNPEAKPLEIGDAVQLTEVARGLEGYRELLSKLTAEQLTGWKIKGWHTTMVILSVPGSPDGYVPRTHLERVPA